MIPNEPTTDTNRDRDMPRISIGLPVYNAERKLEGALDSLLAQTYTDFEVIISDNGSDDRTAEICGDYVKRDHRIRYERQPKNMGLYWNCNRVAEMARGTYFKWSAADVIHDPDFLERCVGALESDASLVCCHSRSDYIDAQGNRLHGVDPSGDTRLATSQRAHRRFADVLFNHGWGARVFGLMRLEAMRRAGLLEYHYGWDKVMMAGLALQGRFHIVEEVLFFEQDHKTVEVGRDDSLGGQAESELPSTHDRDGNSFHRLAFVRGYLQMAWRLSPDWITSVLCTGWVCLYPLQIGKWRRLTCAAITRSTPYNYLCRRYKQYASGRSRNRQGKAVYDERS